MRTLLTFAGSIIYLFVMIIISPLLLALYTGLETVAAIKYIRVHRPAIIPLPSFKMPALHFSIRRYAQHIWAKAAQFHL